MKAMSDPTLPGSPSAGPEPPYGPQPPYGQSPYGQPPYGAQPPYDQPPYGAQPPYDQPPYGAPSPYGPPQYGAQPPYAQSPYAAQSPYGQPPYPAPAPTPTRRRRAGLIALCLGFLAVGVLLGLVLAHGFWPASTAVRVVPGGSGSNQLPFGNGGPNGLPFGNSGGGTSLGGATSSAPGAPSNIRAIAAKVDPAVVDINVTFGALAPGAAGAATGVVISPTGLVLTNNHVIDRAGVIRATDLGNGRTYTATVLGYDATRDVALLQLQGASGLKTASLGDSTRASLGQPVVAIGNAGGVGGRPSAAGGKITGLDRQITVQSTTGTPLRLSGLIATNAAIQRGDSGGPLVNAAGQVIGLNTAASSTLSADGQTGRGFAVPIGTALAVAAQIQHKQSSGTVHVGPTAFLGVALAGPASQAGTGAAIVGVQSGSPAARAGLKAGDTIVSIDGRRIGSAQALTVVIGGHVPGDSVKIGWTDHSGARHVSTITLASGPAH